MKKERIDWKNKIANLVIETLNNNPEWRFPNIRSIFYYLSDALKVIPRTEQHYRKLDALMVKLRKEGKNTFW